MNDPALVFSWKLSMKNNHTSLSFFGLNQKFPCPKCPKITKKKKKKKGNFFAKILILIDVFQINLSPLILRLYRWRQLPWQPYLQWWAPVCVFHSWWLWWHRWVQCWFSMYQNSMFDLFTRYSGLLQSRMLYRWWLHWWPSLAFVFWWAVVCGRL